MSTQQLMGLHEIAQRAKVTPSAVSNWRNRFGDFPKPVAELKSGPVFLQSDIELWLSRRGSTELAATSAYYDRLAAMRRDGPELVACVKETVDKLVKSDTSTRKPGIMLGKIQSGKTRAFLGVIAFAFDRGYDVAVVLTKGTISLTKQTISRIRKDFNEFIDADEVQVYDIMTLPKLTPYELGQKLVLVVKKEDDNLKRLLEAVRNIYPELRQKKILVIDDEADLASVSFRRKSGGVISAGTISRQIDELRREVPDCSFLQVTATPYCLYLQPEEDLVINGEVIFKPKRPSFTVILPTHDQYVGGDYYFERSTDPDSPAYYFFKEVPLEEREALRAEDRRRFKIESVIVEKRVEVLRDAILTFIVGGVMRRLQSAADGTPPQKYSLLFHTERAKAAHAWQERVAEAIHDALVREARIDSPRFNELLLRAFADLERSVNLEGTRLPAFPLVKKSVIEALTGGYLMITRVNSDNEIEELLNDEGQLKLRTPLNMFIGGQILDRGLTLENLIGFYYGRNPQSFQQDTVLQHSRMYGARSMADLAVTRFYAPLHVYQIMQKINEFDGALRAAFESGAHERGVYFVQTDSKHRVSPCSPNKLLLSDVISVRPGRRMVPVGFQTVAKTSGARNLAALDKKIEEIVSKSTNQPILVEAQPAIELLELAYANLEFEDDNDDLHRAQIAALELFSKQTKNDRLKNKVWLLTATDRNVTRYREEGRFSNAPDTKQQSDAAISKADDIPVLMLLRQNGKEEQGWRGLPFWWPVLVAPRRAATMVYSAAEPTVN